jgi:hypothetical protein
MAGSLETVFSLGANSVSADPAVRLCGAENDL